MARAHRLNAIALTRWDNHIGAVRPRWYTFYGFFIEDYITHWTAPDVPTVDPWNALSAVAVRTERIRLGTMVTPLSRRRPWKVARETATLDHLSNGRLILGVGLGRVDDPMNFDRFGEDEKPKSVRPQPEEKTCKSDS